MEKMIKTIQGLIEGLKAEPATPQRDMAIGGLQTAVENLSKLVAGAQAQPASTTGK